MDISMVRGDFMASTKSVPLTITPEATARITELNMHREFEKILEVTLKAFTHVVRIEVIVAWPPDYEDDPRVILETYVSPPPSEEMDVFEQWNQWSRSMGAEFSPDVIRHFLVMEHIEPSNGR